MVRSKASRYRSTAALNESCRTGRSESTDITARLPGFRTFTRTGVRARPPARDSHILTLEPSALAIDDPVILVPGQRDTDATDGGLRGEVLNTECTPVDRAMLSIHVQGKDIESMSDGMGRFIFRALPDGAYPLRVHAPGYIPLLRRETTVSRDRPRSVRVLLERGDGGESDYLGGD